LSFNHLENNKFSLKISKTYCSIPVCSRSRVLRFSSGPCERKGCSTLFYTPTNAAEIIRFRRI